MGSTKILVFQLKDIIKMAVLIIVGIILIGVLIYAFLPKEEQAPQAHYIPGEYTSAIILNNNPISVVVTVSEDRITAIELVNMNAEQEVFYPLIQPTLLGLADEIVQKQSLEVSVSAESAYTSNVLLQAVDSALSKARMQESAQG